MQNPEEMGSSKVNGGR